MNNKNKILIFLVFLFIAGLFGFSFLNPSITGHVSVNINRQNLDLIINESKNFLLTSDNLEPFIITSFKLSGNIAGDGQVKIYIDTGKGQRLLVYDNIFIKKDERGGLSAITGQAIDDTAEEDAERREGTNKGDKWLIIKPIRILLEKEVFEEINDDKYLISEEFNDKCKETCLINMEMSRNVAYRLVFLVEKGTILKLNELIYQTLD